MIDKRRDSRYPLKSPDGTHHATSPSMNANEAADLLSTKSFPRKTTIVTAGSWLASELLAKGVTEDRVAAILPAAIKIYCERRVTARLLGR